VHVCETWAKVHPAIAICPVAASIELFTANTTDPEAARGGRWAQARGRTAAAGVIRPSRWPKTLLTDNRRGRFLYGLGASVCYPGARDSPPPTRSGSAAAVRVLGGPAITEPVPDLDREETCAAPIPDVCGRSRQGMTMVRQNVSTGMSPMVVAADPGHARAE
jgi:hypothetical protein